MNSGQSKERKVSIRTHPGLLGLGSMLFLIKEFQEGTIRFYSKVRKTGERNLGRERVMSSRERECFSKGRKRPSTHSRSKV